MVAAPGFLVVLKQTSSRSTNRSVPRDPITTGVSHDQVRGVFPVRATIGIDRLVNAFDRCLTILRVNQLAEPCGDFFPQSLGFVAGFDDALFEFPL